MARKNNYGKIALVVFLTVLIWIWADLAKTEEFTAPSATIRAKSTPHLWVSFNGKSSVSIGKIELKGPASKIAKVRRGLNDGSLSLEFFLDAEQAEAIKGSGLDVVDFLKNSNQIKLLGLTVESCEPNVIDVQVSKIVKKSLTVKCFGEDGAALEAESIVPQTVYMSVPDNWERAKLVAKVQLTAAEIERARLSAVDMTPYIELGAERNEVPTTVKITMPPVEEQLSDYLITEPSLRIASSPTLQGECYVKVTNLPEVLGVIKIRATPEAKRAYEQQVIPSMTLYIFDEDRKTTEEQKRKVVYNFPEEFVRKNEIKLIGQAVEARFILIPLSPVEAQPSH